MKHTNTRLLAEGAVMVALATVLSFLKLIKFPWGGSVTVLSMLPIVVFALRYGIKKGLAVSFVYAMVQLGQGILLDGLLGWGLTTTALVACMLLDYLLAFSVIGLAGVFGNKSMGGIIGGTILAMALRFLLHFVSGVLIFHSFGELWNGFATNNSWLYCLLYIGAYMLPEALFTAVGAVFLFKTPRVRKLLLGNEK